jgi:hypothetical protein
MDTSSNPELATFRPRRRIQLLEDRRGGGSTGIGGLFRAWLVRAGPCRRRLIDAQRILRHVDPVARHVDPVARHVDPIARRTEPILGYVQPISAHIDGIPRSRLPLRRTSKHRSLRPHILGPRCNATMTEPLATMHAGKRGGDTRDRSAPLREATAEERCGRFAAGVGLENRGGSVRAAVAAVCASATNRHALEPWRPWWCRRSETNGHHGWVAFMSRRETCDVRHGRPSLSLLMR